ncbi:hypothetical protein AQZ52_02080 [Novosphingobium fuchskuhlense]|uniref:Uncharacterized protein n=1 Tax=Novosphingobium fuchskuhlense TaxID=1117702 RepID=A0A117UWH5_9SPHN|nr:hypothetical protein AQZ52_02080 [Novosphingobium fuchskuhlense]
MLSLLPGKGIGHILSRESFIQQSPKVSLKPLGKCLRRNIALDYREAAGPDTVLELLKMLAVLSRSGNIVAALLTRISGITKIEQRAAGHRRIIENAVQYL